MRVLFILALLLLAGCTDIASTRSDTMRVHVIADGEWIVELPFPADPLSQGALRDELRISIGQGNITWQAGPLPLRVEGNGTVLMESLPAWRGVDEVFEVNKGLWSHGDMDDGTAAIQIVDGDIEQISIDHASVACRGRGCDDVNQSAVQCSVETRVFARELAPGSYDVPTAPPVRTCQE